MQQNFNNQPDNLNLAHEFKSEIIKITIEITRGCLCDNWKPSFLCLFLYLTGIHFPGELQHGGDVLSEKSSVDQSEFEK